MPDIRLDQKHLNEQMIRFCRIDANIKHETASQRKERLAKEKSICEGCCHGHAIIDSYMHAIGKFSWWIALKTALSVWDGSVKSLRQQVSLKGASTTKPVSLWYLFKRYTNYIILATAKQEAALPFSEQCLFLGVGDSQLLMDQGRVVGEGVASGHFQKNQLKGLLAKNQHLFGSNVIALIEFSGHSCSFAFTNNKWVFRDPDKTGGWFACVSLDKMLDQIISEYGANGSVDLSVRVATWDVAMKRHIYQFVADYELLLKNNAPSLMSGDGYKLMNWRNYHVVEGLLTRAVVKREKSLIQAFAKILFPKPYSYLTGLEELYYGLPDVMDKLIILVKEDEVFRHQFFKAMLKKDGDGYCLFSIMIEENHTLAIFQILEYAFSVSQHNDFLTKMLAVKINGHVNLLSYLISAMPSEFNRLVVLASNNALLLKRFSVGFKALSTESPGVITILLDPVNSIIGNALIRAAGKSFEIQRTLIRLVLKSGDFVPVLFRLINNPKLLQQILHFKGKMNRYCLVDLVSSDTALSNQLAVLLSHQLNGFNGLQHLALYAPEVVVALCRVAQSKAHQALYQSLSSLLDIPNREGVSPRKILSMAIPDLQMNQLLNTRHNHTSNHRGLSKSGVNVGMWRQVKSSHGSETTLSNQTHSKAL